MEAKSKKKVKMSTKNNGEIKSIAKQKRNDTDRFGDEDELIPASPENSDNLPWEDPYDTPPYEAPEDGERP
jgi:hypothetical protein